VLTACWVEAMGAYANFLVQKRSNNTEVAATLTLLEFGVPPVSWTALMPPLGLH